MTDVHRTIDAVWKLESAKIIAGLTRMVNDVGLAEELAQDALVAALEQWPGSGAPDNPGAWLTTAAKRRAIDHIRRSQRAERKHEQLAHELERQQDPKPPVESEQDDVLRLMFISCHAVLPTEARVALTLRLLGGLTAEEIARAFLADEPAITRRIAQAKRTLAEERVPFELPSGAEPTGRLSSVLEVIYLIFNEGYSATSGDDLMRPGLCLEALRLGRLLHESAAGVRTVLSLNVEHLDLEDRRARVGGAWVSWRSGTARLLPQLVAGRTRGPVFLADRRPGPSRMPREADLCPETGRRRLSYERAEYLFKQATRPLDPAGDGYTLRQLRARR
ncbi:RNA polymerase sigma factor [Sphaerimonospora cavernae]|uniref:RNA polymerase sigma factor n=1 Tax=Sphaerimonospora cavernae TaxID=1740611 RepID=A0ABV6U7W0_9ACTN